MTLTGLQRRDLLDILDRIDDGVASPDVPGAVGRFLRQYARGRADLDRVVVSRALKRREDDAISGRALKPITVHLLWEPVVHVHSLRLGEVARSIGICEEFGCLVQMVMWLNAHTARTAFETLRETRWVGLEGDYRWTPPSRITPGEARVVPISRTEAWSDSRIIKAVADDLKRPPHALEYVRDHRRHQSGVKFFRSICARRRGDVWEVLPGLGEIDTLHLADSASSVKVVRSEAALAMHLVYREPWSDAWTIAESKEVTADMALAHAITWADVQREVRGLPADPEIVSGIRSALHSAGVRAKGIGEPNLTRCILPAACDLLRQVRGI